MPGAHRKPGRHKKPVPRQKIASRWMALAVVILAMAAVAAALIAMTRPGFSAWILRGG